MCPFISTCNVKGMVNTTVLEQTVAWVVEIIKVFSFFSIISSTIAKEMQEAVDRLQSTATDETLETDTLIGEHETQASRQWRELVTPQLPLDMSSAGQLSRSIAERLLTANDHNIIMAWFCNISVIGIQYTQWLQQYGELCSCNALHVLWAYMYMPVTI